VGVLDAYPTDIRAPHQVSPEGGRPTVLRRARRQIRRLARFVYALLTEPP
jgi:hypothetical protein